MMFREASAFLFLFAATHVVAQAPASPPPVPADVSPLYVVTYVELKPAAKAEGAAPFREKLAALRNSPADDRFHNSLSVGPMDLPHGALYVVIHVDVIPPRREDAVAALRVLGEANRSAQGNIRYEVVQQTNRP